MLLKFTCLQKYPDRVLPQPRVLYKL